MGSSSSKQASQTVYPLGTPGQRKSLPERPRPYLKPILKTKTGQRRSDDTLQVIPEGFQPYNPGQPQVQTAMHAHQPAFVTSAYATVSTQRRRPNTPFHPPSNMQMPEVEPPVIPPNPFPANGNTQSQPQPQSQHHTPYQAFGILNRSSHYIPPPPPQQQQPQQPQQYHQPPPFQQQRTHQQFYAPQPPPNPPRPVSSSASSSTTSSSEAYTPAPPRPSVPTPAPVPTNVQPRPRPLHARTQSADIFHRRPNPLPAPPRNVYNESPFNALLNLPPPAAHQHQQSTSSSTAGAGPSTVRAVPLSSAGLTQPQPPARKKSLRRGIFGFGRKKEERPPQVQYVPVYLSQATAPQAPQFQPGASSSSSSNPTSPVAMRFNHTLQPVSFMNHSPHRIMYQNKTYPSATHLHEALKFLDQNVVHSSGVTGNEIAAMIERCGIEEVYEVSTRYNDVVRPDWGSVFLQIMDEVLYLKFKQHVALRTTLLSSGDLDIVYAEPGDAFWGEGPGGQGANELGKAIMRVRTRLRAEEAAHAQG